MKIRAINWTMGDVGHVWLQLKDGECRVDWGDGHTSSIKAPPYQKEIGSEWLYANHDYHKGCKENEEPFTICISSEEDNIVGFLAHSGDMMVESADLSMCQELEYLKSSYLVESLDVTTNPNIKSIDVCGDAANVIDLSKSVGLVDLRLNFSKRTSLDISKCPNLRNLDCSDNYDLTKLVVSNRNELETFTYYNSPIALKYLSYIKADRIGNTEDYD